MYSSMPAADWSAPATAAAYSARSTGGAGGASSCVLSLSSMWRAYTMCRRVAMIALGGGEWRRVARTGHRGLPCWQQTPLDPGRGASLTERPERVSEYTGTGWGGDPMAHAVRRRARPRHDGAGTVGGVAPGAHRRRAAMATAALRRGAGHHPGLARVGAGALRRAGRPDGTVAVRYRAGAALAGGLIFVLVVAYLLARHLAGA